MPGCIGQGLSRLRVTAVWPWKLSIEASVEGVRREENDELPSSTLGSKRAE